MLPRRQFIKEAAQTTSIAFLPLSNLAQRMTTQEKLSKGLTVREVIHCILKEIPGTPFPDSVDTLKSGDENMVVSGIVTTMFATISIIKQAAHANANFIIAHEPTFFNHEDNPQWVPDCKIIQEKRRLLDEYKIAIWRFHDYWHFRKPDGILYGVLNSLGWLPYYTASLEPIIIPPISFSNLITHLKTNLGIPELRIIGNPLQVCQKVVILPGAEGGQKHISMVEKYNPDVLIVGEVHEWETAEYIRDLRNLGGNTNLVVLGHCQSEEPGMKYLAEWLRSLELGVPIQHLPSHDPFVWYSKP